MPALTWRNVDAPDFRSSLAGIGQFNELISQAFSGLDRGLQRYDDQKSEAVNRQFTAELLKYQDADAYKAALAENPTLGFNPRRISSENLVQAGNRVGQLLDNQYRSLQTKDLEGDIAYEGFTRDLFKKDRGALDAFRPFAARLTQAAALRQSDGGKALEALRADPEFQKSYGNLPFEQLVNLATTTQNLEAGSYDIEGKRLGNIRTEVQTEGDKLSNQKAVFDLETGQWRFGQEKIQAADLQAGQRAVQLIDGVAGDTNDARAILQAARLSPAAYAYAVAQVGSRFEGLTGPVGLPATGVSGDPTRIMNYEARAAGYGSIPSSVTTLGGFSDYAKELNGAGVKSSAGGVYQIVGQTLRGKNGKNGYAEKVFGADWRNKPWNFETQDKIAEAIFNDHRGSADALRGQWTSLSPAEAERVRKLPWVQAREIIARGESSSSPAALAGRPPLGARPDVSATIEATLRNSQNANNSVSTEFLENANDRRSVKAVAAALAADEFKEADQSYIRGQIQRIMDKTGGNAAQAGAILARAAREGVPNFPGASVGGPVGVFNSLVDFVTGNQPTSDGRLKDGRYIDQKKLDRFIKEATSGQVVGNATETVRLNEVSAQVKAAESAYTQAQAAYAAARQAYLSGDPRAATLVPRLEQQLEIARRNVILVRSAADQSQNRYRRK